MPKGVVRICEAILKDEKVGLVTSRKKFLSAKTPMETPDKTMKVFVVVSPMLENRCRFCNPTKINIKDIT